MRKIEEQKAKDLNDKLATLRENFEQEQKAAQGFAEEAKAASEKPPAKTSEDVEMGGQSSACQPSQPEGNNQDPLEEIEHAALAIVSSATKREASEEVPGLSFIERAKAARTEKKKVTIALPETIEETPA